jgi:hypothetical protein
VTNNLLFLLRFRLLTIVHNRECAQARQDEVARGWDTARDPQPGGARRQALLNDEVPRGRSKIANDDDVRV